MNNIIDAYALSPPSAEITEPSGKGYVLIPLGKGEVPELTDYPYEVLMVRPDYVEANPEDRHGGGAGDFAWRRALPQQTRRGRKPRCEATGSVPKTNLPDDVFELSYSTWSPAPCPLGAI